MSGMSIATYLKALASLHCPACVEDEEVTCPRNCDVLCIECGARLCGHHIVRHLDDVHCISIEWRGALKEDAAGGAA